MASHADPHAWAEYTFGQAKLGDPRRTRRLVESASGIAAHPEKSFTQIFDWNQLRGFYGLCNSPQATLQSIQSPHWLHTRADMAAQPLVLILHDTTTLDFSSHKALTGTGPVGDGNGRGFLQHNSLAVLPEPRQVLGLAYQQFYVRQPVAKEGSYRRKKRQRESRLWPDGIRASGKAPEGCCWVDVADCASDDYEAMRASREADHHFLFRICQDRVVWLSAQGERRTHLLQYARSLPSQGSDQVDIPGRGGRPARTANVSLATAEVWVPAPHGTAKRWEQPVFHAWVVRVWEPEPPAGAEALEWVLLCSVPTEGLAQLRQRRDWYSCRWMAEVYHDIEKNGCREEDRRFETAEAMEPCLAILAVVAVRVYQLRCALQATPEAPAQQVATKAEIEVISRRLGKKTLSVRDFVRAVASLGGFLGRKGDGEPGVRTLWRGYQRLQDMVAGYQLRLPPFSGP